MMRGTECVHSPAPFSGAAAKRAVPVSPALYLLTTRYHRPQRT